MPQLLPQPVTHPARKQGKLPYALTRRTLLLLLAGTLFLVPAFFQPRFTYAMLAWDATVLILALIDALTLPPPQKLTARREFLTTPALDNPTRIELTLTQTARQTLTVTLLDNLPAPFLVSPVPLRLTARPNLPAKAQYTFTPRQRGDHPTGDLYLNYRSSIGLAARWATAPLSQTVRIYPNPTPGASQELYLARARQIEMQLRKQRLRGQGREFESLRDYREGDDLRDVCWTAAARRGQLVSRQYHIERNQPVWIVLDCGRLQQARVGAYTKLDHACATALALARLALSAQDRVGLLAYGQTIQQTIRPDRGPTQLRQLMESLALVRTEPGEADHLRAAITFMRLQPRRALVLWLTDMAETAMRPEVLDAAAQILRRHLLLFVAIQQADLKQTATQRPKNTTQMYRTAAAMELLHRREILLARLRQKGAWTLETTPESMTPQILNRYLEVKEQSLL